MFIGVNFLVMLNALGYIHSVILNRSSDNSSENKQLNGIKNKTLKL